MDESWFDGKHCGRSGRASARSSRGPVPRLIGTAVYGPVRTVVWDPWLALEVSHGDPILQMLSVNISTMPDPYDRHNKFSTVDIIDDSIITNTYSVCMIRSYELLAACRHRVISKTINRGNNSWDPLTINLS
jgi:hypothetical protein